MDDTLASKTHAWACKQGCKDAYKPMGGTNKHGKDSFAWSKKREGYTWIDTASEEASQMVTPKQGLMGVGCNHTTTILLRMSNMTKPRTRKANTSIKHRSKQAYTCKIGMIQSL